MNDETEPGTAAAAPEEAGGKLKIRRLSIEPGDNGGHTVEHDYKRVAVTRKGRMNSGLDYEHPESKSFPIGPGQDQQLLDHIVEHLGLKVGKHAGPKGA